ncbi:MAG TPA: DNA-binding domain-containing protein [Anaeromyxobacteraceae bacterium]|nr:DNA-binding domain-containing protein [Anaeromyxobacteraceae bacterium]
MTLAETQALVHQAITSGTEPARGRIEGCIADTPTLSSHECVEVYANMYLWRLVDALRETFPNLSKHLGDGAFAGLAEDYVRRHPSEHHDIGQMGKLLPAFLREYPDPERPDLADLAELEWARNEVFFAPDGPAMDEQVFNSIPAAKLASLRLQLVPSVRVLRLAHDATDLWRRLENGEPPGPSMNARATAVVWRRDFQVFHCNVSLREGEALRAARAGGTLGEVCACFEGSPEPASEAFTAISSWLVERWLEGSGDAEFRSEASTLGAAPARLS